MMMMMQENDPNLTPERLEALGNLIRIMELVQPTEKERQEAVEWILDIMSLVDEKYAEAVNAT